jgi:hypothetical protein
MSTDIVNKNTRHSKDTIWDYLIAVAEDQIVRAQLRTSDLSKAIVFFTKKKAAGERFPVSVKKTMLRISRGKK